jgi:hypothetical protein
VLAIISNSPESNKKIMPLDDIATALANRNEKPSGINSEGILVTQFADSNEDMTGNKRNKIRI